MHTHVRQKVAVTEFYSIDIDSHITEKNSRLYLLILFMHYCLGSGNSVFQTVQQLVMVLLLPFELVAV